MFLGGACRIRVLRSLHERFSTPEEAEQFFMQLNKENCEKQQPSTVEEEVSSIIEENILSDGSIIIQSVDILRPSFVQVSMAKPDDQIQFVSEMFAVYCSSQNVAVPSDFLQLAIKGMTHLKNAGRSNVLYNLSKGLGTKRSDGSDTRFPCKQVVTGLLEHCVNFFNATYGDQVLKRESLVNLSKRIL